MTDPLRGKMASNERINANVQKIVEFDRAYQALVVSGDKDGLCVALTQNISCVARMAEQAALGIEACKAVPFILFK